MSNNKMTLFAIIDNDSTPQAFLVDIELSKTVGHFKDLILAKNPHTLRDIDARTLKPWRVSVAIPEDEAYDHVVRAIHCDNKKLLAPAKKLTNVFGTNPDGSLIHVLVQGVIKRENPHILRGLDTRKFRLWRVSIPIPTAITEYEEYILLDGVDDKVLLAPSLTLADITPNRTEP